MNRRINIAMPETTIRSIDQLVKPGERSQFIKRAVEHYMASQSTDQFQQLLEMTAVRDRDIDQQVCDDWAAVDQKAWHQFDHQENTQAKPAIRKGAKSTSRRLTQR